MTKNALIKPNSVCILNPLDTKIKETQMPIIKIKYFNKFLTILLLNLNLLHAMDSSPKIEEVTTYQLTGSTNIFLGENVKLPPQSPNAIKIFNILPHDVIYSIFNYLELNDLFRVRNTCLQFKILTQKIGDILPKDISYRWSPFYPQLKILDIINLQFDSKHINALAEMVSRNTSLKSLNLQDIKISLEGIKSLAASVERNSTITSLSLRRCDINFEGGMILSPALAKNTSITYLDLYNNHFCYAGAISLAETLKKNSSITYLNLSCNGVGDRGAPSMGAMLEKNKSLRYLNLEINWISLEGIRILTTALENNTSLICLNLGYYRYPGYNEINIEDAASLKSKFGDRILVQ